MVYSVPTDGHGCGGLEHIGVHHTTMSIVGRVMGIVYYRHRLATVKESIVLDEVAAETRVYRLNTS